MRVFRKNDAGEAVCIADYPLPRFVCDELHRGNHVYLDLPPVTDIGRPRYLVDKWVDRAATFTVSRVRLEPYRLYLARVLVETGAMIADSTHVELFVEHFRKRSAAEAELQSIVSDFVAERQTDGHLQRA